MNTTPTLQLITTSSALTQVQDRTREVLDLFLANQNSEGTKRTYRVELNLFFRFIGKTVDQVTSGDLLSYKDFISHLRPATIGRKLTTLRAFFQFCLAEGIIDRDPTVNLKLPKVPEGSPKALSIVELKRLFTCIDRTTPGGLRDSAMFRLMVSGGLRRAEVRDLDHADLEPKDGFLRVHIRNGKGGKSRHVDVDLSIYDAIMEYARSMGVDFSGPVFLGEVRGFKKTPGRISLSSINARLKVYSEASGVPCTVHSLRHSYASLAEGNGCLLEDLRTALGHSSLSTTQKYIRRLNDQRNPVMDFVPTF